MRYLLCFLLVSCGTGQIVDMNSYGPQWIELGEVVEQFEDGAVVDGMFDEDAGAFDEDPIGTVVEDETATEAETQEPTRQPVVMSKKSGFKKIDAGTFDCKYGGTVNVTVSDVPPVLQAGWTFTACADKRDKTTDGTITYEFRSDTVTASYDATLTYTGKDAGSCTIVASFTGKLAEKFKKHLCKVPKIKK